MSGLVLTLERANTILAKHSPDNKVHKVSQVKKDRFSHSKGSAIYLLYLSNTSSGTPTRSSFITVSEPLSTQSREPSWHANSLSTVLELIKTIKTQTTIPLKDSILDTSLELVPFEYILTPPYPVPPESLVPLSAARSQLTEQQKVLVDLTLGKMLGELHNVVNDWYGLPSVTPPSDPSYSWQETFTSLLDYLLSLSPHNTPALQTALGRAIAFYLFDDVEWPSLVWLTGSEDDIYLSSSRPGEIAAILPSLSHALWGDPLLESFFLPPGPSDAFFEGYGSRLIVFPRQKTKRLWYDVFLCLLILKEPESGDKRKWAVERLQECAEKLKIAPCY